MNERIQLPIRPTGPSLGAYVAAIDLLAAKLDTLTTRARWPARVPVNSKASFDGDIVHTNQLKVNIGGEWWVEMSAAEAADYVRRRKAYFLDEHARLLEGKPRADTVVEQPADDDVVMAPAGPSRQAPSVRFDPLFASPVRVASPEAEHAAPAAPVGKEGAKEAVKEKQATPAAVQKRVAPSVAVTPATPSTPSDPALASTSREAPAEPAAPGGVSIPGLPKELQYLVDLMGTHMGDKLSLPHANGGNETVNEEGLPIHEIREDADGNTIGEVPESSGEGVVTVNERDEDYWGAEAAARREALRRRIFHDDGSDDDDEADEMDVDSPPVAEPAPAAALEADPETPPLAPFPGPHRSPSIAPKSILKAPTRKKSVTFDPSTRLPPDSPPVGSPGGSLGIGKIGNRFPLGDFVRESTGPKPVPILAPPTPGRKTAPAATFGGFKRGFLTGPGSKPPPIPAASSAVIEEGPKVVEVDGDVEMEQPAEDKPKKQSLFAQRRAQANSGAPQLPRLADAKPMATMKTAIVETPPIVVQRAPEPVSSLADRLPTPAVPRAPVMPPPVGTLSHTPVVVHQDDDDDDSEYGDLGEFSDDEDDEYALDEALLAREVALEYHRRQAWQRPIDEDEIDPEAEDQQGTGGVLMGVPRVSTITGGSGSDNDPLRIVNPTADDLSQFLRVGRAEDGELVFEQPIIHSGSESEGEGEGNKETEAQAADRRARRARRKDVMERLLRGDYEDEAAAADSPAAQRAAWERSLPPSVTPTAPAPAPVAVPTPAPVPAAPSPAPAPARRIVETGPVVERSAVTVPAAAPAGPTPPAPKKVSRFKAARQQA